MLNVNAKSLIKQFSKLMDTLIDLGMFLQNLLTRPRGKRKHIDNKDFISEAKKFSINSDRVDEFYARI